MRSLMLALVILSGCAATNRAAPQPRAKSAAELSAEVEVARAELELAKAEKAATDACYASDEVRWENDPTNVPARVIYGRCMELLKGTEAISASTAQTCKSVVDSVLACEKAKELATIERGNVVRLKQLRGHVAERAAEPVAVAPAPYAWQPVSFTPPEKKRMVCQPSVLDSTKTECREQ